jgi:hypothetical protein
MPALKRFCFLAEFSQLANFLNMAKKMWFSHQILKFEINNHQAFLLGYSKVVRNVKEA